MKKTHSTKGLCRLTLSVLIIAVALTLRLIPGEAGGMPSTFQEGPADTTGTPPDTVETSPPDSMQIRQKKPSPSILSTMPGDSTTAPRDTVESSSETVSPPDTSEITQPVSDTTISPVDTTGLPGTPADTATTDLVPPDTTQLPSDEPDTTAESPADTMFGKTYLTYVGESMFTHERISPFPAHYLYKYGGLEGDTTFQVNLTTKFMQQSYTSHFHFPASGTDTVAIGPYDVQIESVDSVTIVFELLGYTQLPEPDIPEPVEEVAEATATPATAPAPLPQLERKESPTTAKEYFSRGYIRAAEGKLNEAKQDLQTALEMDSTLYDARLLLGWILTDQNDSTALEILRDCTEFKPDDTTALFFLAYSLQKLGSSDEAVESYAKISEIDSSNARALFQLASLSKTRGDSLKADELLAKAQGINPEIDSISASPSLSDIAQEFWWLENGPQLTHYEEAVYPDSATADSLECTVSLLLLVDEKGKPAKVEEHEPCDYAGFNEAAETAAWKCTFSPGTINNRPVSAWVTVPFRFELPMAEEPATGPEEVSDSTLIGYDVVPDTGEVPPKLIDFVQPEYPQEAMEDSIETTVLLSVLVGTDGSVNELKFIRPDTVNQAFNQAAEAAARQCRFQPGLRDGSPDTMWAELRMTFSLTAPPPSLPAVPPPRRERPVTPEGRGSQLPAGAQDKASAYIQGTMLAQQGKYDEALDLIRGSLQSDPQDDNSQLLYGLILLAKETEKRMDEVTSLVGQPEKGVYWWAETMPQIQEFKEADYPDGAKESGAEGTVILYVLVDGSGAVQKVTVVSPLEEDSLNDAAEQAATGCTFTPGTLGGEPVKVWTRLPYEFKLSE